jgi:RNA polymerase-binding protein DksA
MNATQIRNFKRRLIAEELYLRHDIDDQAAEQEMQAEAAGEERLSGFDDTGSELFEHEKALAMEGTLEHILADVHHALHKMDAGNYGLCDNCGQPIPQERLKARPQATLCLACRIAEERAHHGRKPVPAGA